ncbi:MAG: thioredoxin family protein [Nanoarchaeota archaeon]
MHQITKEDFEQKVKKSKKMVVVDFSGKNCQPCQKLHPILKKISEMYKDKDYIDFYEIDMKGNEDFFNKFGIMTIPHIIFFHKGKQIDELIGFRNEDTILNFLKKNIVEISKPEYFVE